MLQQINVDVPHATQIIQRGKKAFYPFLLKKASLDRIARIVNEHHSSGLILIDNTLHGIPSSHSGDHHELLLESATEAASACLNMENGTLLLVWSGEPIRDLAAAGYVRSATLAVQKLCETVDTEARWIGDGEMRKEEKLAWFQLFAEALNTIRSSS